MAPGLEEPPVPSPTGSCPVYSYVCRLTSTILECRNVYASDFEGDGGTISITFLHLLTPMTAHYSRVPLGPLTPKSICHLIYYGLLFVSARVGGVKGPSLTLTSTLCVEVNGRLFSVSSLRVSVWTVYTRKESRVLNYDLPMFVTSVVSSDVTRQKKEVNQNTYIQDWGLTLVNDIMKIFYQKFSVQMSLLVTNVNTSV